MFTAIKNFILNTAWQFRILSGFFIAFAGLIFVVSTLMSLLFLINAKDTTGEILSSTTEVTKTENGTHETTTLILTYTLDDRETTGRLVLDESASPELQAGRKIEIAVSGKHIKRTGWLQNFAVPIASGMMLILLVGVHLLLRKMKYEPKDWVFTNPFKRYD